MKDRSNNSLAASIIRSLDNDTYSWDVAPRDGDESKEATLINSSSHIEIRLNASKDMVSIYGTILEFDSYDLYDIRDSVNKCLDRILIAKMTRVVIS